MKLLARIAAVVFVAVALFLVAAVINALASEEGARAGVAVLYVAISTVLTFLAVTLWRLPRRRATSQDA